MEQPYGSQTNSLQGDNKNDRNGGRYKGLERYVDKPKEWNVAFIIEVIAAEDIYSISCLLPLYGEVWRLFQLACQEVEARKMAQLMDSTMNFGDMKKYETRQQSHMFQHTAGSVK
ncbi:hypothetical protein YC2023_070951 [Brassica napus]